jgi:branched-chain amino acid transport system permease protein
MECLITIVVVVGLYIFIGNSGVVSFGHIAFMAIGAYASAWQTCCLPQKPANFPGLPDFLLHSQVPNFPASLLAGLLAAAVAYLSGLIIMRLSGIGASIGTFAFLAIVNVVYSNWKSVTLGTSSIIGLPTYVNLWTALAWALTTIAVANVFQVSSLGLALRASREDEVAAQAAGINVYVLRLIAFVLSAFFVAIGGVLRGHFLGIVAVNSFWLDATFTTLAMLVVGGMNSLAGAVTGVVALSVLIEFLRRLESGIDIGSLTLSVPGGFQELGLAVVMLAILILRPKGLTGNREAPCPWPPTGARRQG